MAANPPVNPILDPLASEIKDTVNKANELRDALSNAASAAKSNQTSQTGCLDQNKHKSGSGSHLTIKWRPYLLVWT